MAEPKAGDIIINPIDNAEMVWVPAGESVVGSDPEDLEAVTREHPEWDTRWFADEQPRRTVTLEGFWVYKYPVTVAQYRAFCEANGREMPPEPEWGWQDDHPMVNVTWDDAQAYATWAGVSMPDEDQWEKAARGDDARLWPWGNDAEAARCVNAANSKSTQPVGSHPEGASPYGVMDMAGNVWEWCTTRLGALEVAMPAHAAAQRRSPAPRSLHVLRGGSWLSGYVEYLRCAYRCHDCNSHRGRFGYRRPSCGFRCVTTKENPSG
ncbi:MAG: formylglycine-generating enzyme family protein [Armatimonadota bacterium]